MAWVSSGCSSVGSLWMLLQGGGRRERRRLCFQGVFEGGQGFDANGQAMVMISSCFGQVVLEEIDSHIPAGE